MTHGARYVLQSLVLSPLLITPLPGLFVLERLTINIQSFFYLIRPVRQSVASPGKKEKTGARKLISFWMLEFGRLCLACDIGDRLIRCKFIEEARRVVVPLSKTGLGSRQALRNVPLPIKLTFAGLSVLLEGVKGPIQINGRLFYIQNLIMN